MTKFKNLALVAVLSFCAMFAVGFAVNAFSGAAPSTVIEHAENVNVEASSGEEFGAVVSPYSYPVLQGLESMYAVAQEATSSVVLTSLDSGKTVLLSATGTDITLPAVGFAGVNFKFQVNGAMGVENMVIYSAEGDNIEGTLIVAGAVVDCAAEDQLNFVIDGENIGDYFEIMSDGSQWLLGDSGVLTASKLTCTDPA